MPSCSNTMKVCDMADEVWFHGSVPLLMVSRMLLQRGCHPRVDSTKERAGFLACRNQARIDAIGLDTSGWSLLPNDSCMAVRDAPTGMWPVATAIVDLGMLVALSSAPTIVRPYSCAGAALALTKLRIFLMLA